MAEEIGTKALSEVRELKVKLYGEYPPKDENDVGAIGLIQRDLAKIRKTFRFLEGVPGIIVKIVGTAAAFAAIWKAIRG